MSKKSAEKPLDASSRESAAAVPPTRRALMKQATRERIAQAAIRMLRTHGFHAMTIEQIVDAAGTTRPTFYQYFAGKADLIGLIQERCIAPEMIAVCQRLDAIDFGDRAALRAWINDYARTWSRIHTHFDAYSQAALQDPAVARTIVPHTAEITAHMTRLLGRFDPAQHPAVQGKLDLLLNLLASTMARVHAVGEDPTRSPLLDSAAAIFWDALFSFSKPPSARAPRASPKRLP